MIKLVYALVLCASLFLPQQLHSQNTADSLRTLMTGAEKPRKVELSLQLASHYLAEHPDSTLYYGRIARTIGNEEKNHVAVIRSYAMTGEAYQKLNKMKEAIADYQKGLALAEKHNEQSLAGTIYNGIGTCYYYLSDLKKAEAYFNLAAQAKKAANDYQYYAFISANLAALQIANQSPAKAIKTLKDAEKALLKNKQDAYLPTVYNSLGAAYQTVKPDSCVYYYEKSLAIGAKNKDYTNQMTVNQNLGDYFLGRKEYAKAIGYMKSAIAINALRPEDPYKPALFERISAVYDSIGDYKNAYHYKKQEAETRQRLFTVAKQKEIDELEIKYQSEKKEKELQLRKQEIAKVKSQQIALVIGAIFLFVVGGLVAYLVFQRKRITQKFEQEKLRLFENILHDIRTPLTLIEGPIKLMKQNPGAHADHLALMERNSARLMALVDELLDASKLQKGSFELHYTKGNIADCIEGTLDSFAGEAKSKGITIHYDKQASENTPLAFPLNAVGKIVSNLVGNAVKYCPPKSEVYVTSQVDGRNLILRVRDTGPGIPRKEQRKVFRRFFRGTQAAHTSGTGIGLSLVKELVELADGTIALQSDPNGTAFLVSIPLHDADAVAAPSNKTDFPTLLLVEDDADTAAFSMSVLKEQFHIIHAQNGNDAMRLIHENLPDIVLSDIMMPGKDGIALLQDIRSDEFTTHLPVILFSAKSSLESRLRGLQHGADAYIAKPFSPEELKLTVRNLFTAIQRNKDAYKAGIQTGTTFEERIMSPHAYVNKIIAHIIRNIDNRDYSVNELAADMAVSRSQLHRKLTALTGFSTTNFISMVRLEKAKDLLLKQEGNVTEIAYQCGFGSQSYFTRSFTEYFGKSPSQFLKEQ